ncbi:hypothetical protein CABS01_14460 [Colletotrichum abscissum]|uniref:uncharacterized protein n=1 Tax=Colletotrichum abscissum TaxID=1671311 RepID=UPI0027D6DDCA|nr:uncharacterized protein CABS01_14460 [Colletotrichum abscissum]KAK1480322.1 hypothetical protein CABS01_14460 [Colletotrichum abscissum]
MWWRSLSLHLLSCSVGLVIGARLLFGLEKSASCVKSTDGHDSSGGGVEALRLFSAHFRPDDMVRTRTEAYRIKQTETLCQGMRCRFLKTAQRTGLSGHSAAALGQQQYSQYTCVWNNIRRARHLGREGGIKQGLKGTEKRGGRSKLQRVRSDCRWEMQPSNGTICRCWCRIPKKE